MNRKRYLPLLLLAVLILNSCIGLSMDIQMRRDGSGRISMEYQVSALGENIGRLDGNERWPAIPVGRADWERSVARLPGIRLVSFSSRERERDVVTNVTLEFENTEALVNLLDPSGTRASFNRIGESNRLGIILNEPVTSDINTDLLDLIRQVSAGYSISISFSADGGSSNLTVTDGNGRETTPPQNAQIVSSGRNVSFSIDTGEILSLRNGLGLNLSW